MCDEAKGVKTIKKFVSVQTSHQDLGLRCLWHLERKEMGYRFLKVELQNLVIEWSMETRNLSEWIGALV